MVNSTRVGKIVAGSDRDHDQTRAHSKSDSAHCCASAAVHRGRDAMAKAVSPALEPVRHQCAELSFIAAESVIGIFHDGELEVRLRSKE